jgi:hypothetical protein
MPLKTTDQIKKASTSRLYNWLKNAENQDQYDIIKSVLLYREETAQKMQASKPQEQADDLIASRPDLQFTIVNRPMGVVNEGKTVLHKDEWYWPFHTGINKPIGKYPCDRDNPKMQNTDLIQLGLQIAGGIGAEVTKVVSLKGGASLLVGVMMPEKIEVGTDTYEQYVYILDNRTGEHGLKIGFGNRCLRCANQMTFVKKSIQLNVKHTSGMHDKLQSIVESIDMVRQMMQEQFSFMRELLAIEVDEAITEEFIKTVTGYDEHPEGSKAKVKPAGHMEYAKLSEIMQIEQSQVGMNAYSLLQGVTNLVTHHHDVMYRKTVGFEENMIYEKGGQKITTALELLESFIAN